MVVTTHPLFGADVLAAEPSLLGPVDRVALATTDAARSALAPDLTSRAMLLAAELPIERLFAPEHGLQASAADGAPVEDALDALTGLPITSLYGARFAPPVPLLRHFDAVLFDMPDVGARCYTYAWTLTHLIDACADARVPVWVLDRPNPVGGTFASVEGPLLEPQYQSFVGRHSIPLRHALTLGELALLWQRERRPDAQVHVIGCRDWRRAQLWPDTGLPWTPTSPAITRFEAALLYPGLVLFEATNLSVARGTPLAFRAVGAPWLDADAVLGALGEDLLAGVEAVAGIFTPGSGPHAGAACTAITLHVRAAAVVRPVALGLGLLGALARVHRTRFRWATYPTAANPSGEDHLERLVGTAEVRSLVERGSLDAATARRLTAAEGWKRRWEAVRLYA